MMKNLMLPKDIRNILERVEKEKKQLPKEYIHPEIDKVFNETNVLWIKYGENQLFLRHSAIVFILDFELNYFKEVNKHLMNKHNLPPIKFKEIFEDKKKRNKSLNKIDQKYDIWFSYFVTHLETVIQNVNIRDKQDLIKLATICNNRVKSLKRLIENKKEPEMWMYDVLEDFFYQLKRNKYMPFIIEQKNRFETIRYTHREDGGMLTREIPFKKINYKKNNESMVWKLKLEENQDLIDWKATQ